MKELLKKFIPPFLLSWYHYILALLGAIFYCFPSCPPKFSFGKFRWARKIKVIGVTGTNGKSTVVELTSKVLEEAGYKIASLSSIKFKIGDEEWKNMFKMTMPGRFTIQKILRQAVKAGCQYAILEVTSEGIKQHRHKFINFEIAIFTNLTPEHIEAHAGFKNYRAAKGKLFQATKNIHVINIDDENAEYFLQFPAKEKHLYKIKNQKSPKDPPPNFGGRQNSKLIEVENYEIFSEGLKFSVESTEFNLKLLGEFNIYNSLAAICVGRSQGVDLETCKQALEKVKGIPGRMEEVISQPFKVIVDYAVTPDALEKLYQTIKKIFSPQRIIAVFGSCGGGRDRWRRPVLGEIAAKYCHKIIITDEDPYDEDPYQILSMIKSGILKSHFPTTNFYEILDRREAIRKSLELARAGDIVLITGKGCEPWICMKGGKKIPWDDRKIVKEEFEKLRR